MSAMAIMASVCQAQVSVTASRAYVDRKTTLHPVTNDGEVVGYNLGSNTNVTLLSSDSAISAGTETKRFALFIIPVSAEYPDFELKATTNNYVKADGEYEAFCPFFASSSLNGTAGWPADSFRMYACYSKLNADGESRRWTRLGNTVDDELSTNVATIAVIVDPTLMGRGQGYGWLSDHNDELIWNYIRINDIDGPEKEVPGDSSSPWLWRQVMPVKWYSRLPSWADQ